MSDCATASETHNHGDDNNNNNNRNGKPSGNLPGSDPSFPGGNSEVLEGRYLALIKKTKALTVQLELEKSKSKKLQEQLDFAAEKAREKKATGAAAAAKPGKPSWLAEKLPFLDVKEETSEAAAAVGDGGGGDNTTQHLKDRLERAYSQLRAKDIQLCEMRRGEIQLKSVLARELGKTPEELNSWLCRVPVNGGSNNSNELTAGVATAAAALGAVAGEPPDGWKSRAEQIALLKGKLKDMERIVAAYQNGEEPPPAVLLTHSEKTQTSTADHESSSATSDHYKSQQQQQQQQEPSGSMGKEEIAALVANGGDDLESLMQLAKQTYPKHDEQDKTDHNATAAPKGSAPSVSSFRTGGGSGGTATTTTAAITTRRDVDDNARDAIADLTSRRLKGLREVEKELAQRTDALKTEKGKQAALQGRLASLQRDNAQLRAHVQAMLAKSRGDDELVAAYKTELAEAAIAFQHLKNELAERCAEDAKDSRAEDRAVHSPSANSVKSQDHANHQSNDAAVIASLRQEKAALLARLEQLTGPNASTAAGAASPSVPVKNSEEKLARWARRIAGDAMIEMGEVGEIGGADGGQSTTSSSPPPPVVAALLRAAYAHVLLVERRLQALNESNSRHVYANQSKDNPPGLPQALLLENANLKERVRSLTELLMKETQRQARMS